MKMECQNCHRELEKHEIIKDVFNNDTCSYCGSILKITLIITCYSCKETYPIELNYGENGINNCLKCNSSNISDATPKDQLPDYLREQLS